MGHAVLYIKVYIDLMNRRQIQREREIGKLKKKEEIIRCERQQQYATKISNLKQ